MPFGESQGHAVTPVTQQCRVGEILSQSISSMGRNLAAGIERRRQIKSENKTLRALANTVINHQKEVGVISPAEAEDRLADLEGASHRELKALYHSNILQSTLRSQQELAAQRTAQMGRADRADQRAERADQRAQQMHDAQMARDEANEPMTALRQRMMEQNLTEGDLQNELLGLQLEKTRQSLAGYGLEMPEGLEISGATVGADGDISYTYRAGGKDLTQTEIQKLAAIKQAQRDIDSLEDFYINKPAGFGGPISGRAKSVFQSLFGSSPETQRGENLADSAAPNIARGVFGEVGVLTDKDIQRYRGLLPLPSDTDTTRRNKIKDLTKRLKAQLQEQESMLQGAGRNLPAPTTKESGEIQYRRGTAGNLER